MEGDSKEDFRGDFRRDFKQDMEGDLLSSSGKVGSRLGLVQVRSGAGLVQVTAQIDKPESKSKPKDGKRILDSGCLHRKGKKEVTSDVC